MTTKGERLKLLRENANLTQEELAVKLNTTKQTISKYEKNIVTNIPSDRIEALCSILDSTPEYILSWRKANTEEKINSNANASITNRLLQDSTFNKVVKMLNQLEESQLEDVITLLNVSFKNCFNEDKK